MDADNYVSLNEVKREEEEEEVWEEEEEEEVQERCLFIVFKDVDE